MPTNKTNAVNDNGTVANNSNFSALKSESLDQLYKEQLIDLRNLVLKKAQTNDIEICRKWIKVFNRISNSEKMARNCLCVLMQEQMQEFGYLKEPFTNLRNCNRNLESVFNELDDMLSTNLENEIRSCRTSNTFQTEGFEKGCEQQQQLKSQDVLLNTKTAEFTSELLQSLRTQLIEKEMENFKLKEIAEKYRIESESHEATLHMAKTCILENIKVILLEMQQRAMGVPARFFQIIFSQFPYRDEQFDASISKYDQDLQIVFQKQLKCGFDKRKSMIAAYISRKFAKNKIKLREKYERHLNEQSESHKLQLKLAKLNSFSILRQIFINLHDKFDKVEGWQILKALEDKYQSILNGQV